jgi:hypothetical protein
MKQKNNRKNRHKMDTPNTQIHDRLLSCFGTGISIKSCGVRLVLWDQTSPLSEIMRSNEFCTWVIFLMKNKNH